MFSAAEAFAKATKITDEQRIEMIKNDLTLCIRRFIIDIRNAVIEAMQCGSTEAHHYMWISSLDKYGKTAYTAIKNILTPAILDSIARKFRQLGYEVIRICDGLRLSWEDPDPEKIVIKQLEMDEIVTSAMNGFRAIKNS